MNFTIGDWGHLSVLIAFVSALLSTISYYKAAVLNPLGLYNPNNDEYLSWKKFGRNLFYIHSFFVLSVAVSLYIIIYTHRYDYHYAWSHSANGLPWYYMISCFWEGQEGSFLLWIFWHVVLGAWMVSVNKKWEVSFMTIFMLVQMLLLSMIIGVVIPGIEFKIGSSPFILLKEFMPDMPVYQINPDFVPQNGSGLNPLLQNYWMVIHPPTLFLGFASTLIPFAYAIAGLWQNKFKEWVQPALPWSLVAALTLGTGIIMGAYWAYETLNFGGYWNWDPVENAVYVPWLILIGAIHLMISYKSVSGSIKSALIMVIAMFVLILYSTFLTRSGILGESSVHSFTDLGLYWQLLISLLSVLGVGVFLMFKKWKEIPVSEKEADVWSREFWLFIGVTILSLSAFHIIYVTSIPVYNAFFKTFGLDFKFAPPADAVEHYSNWQIWFVMAIAILSGVAQFFWWQKADKVKLWNSLSIPLLLTMLLTTIIVLSGIIGWSNYLLDSLKYILLLLTALFLLISNATIFFKLVRSNVQLSGGAIAHIGVALMLLGVLYSAGYSRTISLNTSGLVYSTQMSDEENNQNILLFRNDPQVMGEFKLIYKGSRVESPQYHQYLNSDNLIMLPSPDKAVTTIDLKKGDEVIFHKGDTLEINPENTYYEVKYIKALKDTFTLFPRLQRNKQMGTVVSPDILRFAGRDLYSHLAGTVPLSKEEREWSEPKEYKIKIKDTLYINDYITIIDEVERINHLPTVDLTSEDIAIKAHIRILGKEKDYHLHPAFVLRTSTGELGVWSDVNEDLGVKMSLTYINPETEEFTLEVSTTQKDYIILKVIEKPMINLLWLGTIVLIIGFGVAIYRRYREFGLSIEKNV